MPSKINITGILLQMILLFWSNLVEIKNSNRNTSLYWHCKNIWIYPQIEMFNLWFCDILHCTMLWQFFSGKLSMKVSQKHSNAQLAKFRPGNKKKIWPLQDPLKENFFNWWISKFVNHQRQGDISIIKICIICNYNTVVRFCTLIFWLTFSKHYCLQSRDVFSCFLQKDGVLSQH
jgi:hypothetical protein